jgi:hypothetical protein
MNKQEAQALIAKHGGSLRATQKATGICRQTLRRALAGGVVAPKKATKVDDKAGAAAKSLGDFRAAYDKDFIIPRKIRDGLKTIGASGWEYEVAFAKLAGVSLADLSAYRSEFADYVVEIRRDSKRAWAGSKSTANQMRSML